MKELAWNCVALAAPSRHQSLLARDCCCFTIPTDKAALSPECATTPALYCAAFVQFLSIGKRAVRFLLTLESKQVFAGGANFAPATSESFVKDDSRGGSVAPFAALSALPVRYGALTACDVGLCWRATWGPDSVRRMAPTVCDGALTASAGITSAMCTPSLRFSTAQQQSSKTPGATLMARRARPRRRQRRQEARRDGRAARARVNEARLNTEEERICVQLRRRPAESGVRFSFLASVRVELSSPGRRGAPTRPILFRAHWRRRFLVLFPIQSLSSNNSIFVERVSPADSISLSASRRSGRAEATARRRAPARPSMAREPWLVRGLATAPRPACGGGRSKWALIFAPSLSSSLSARRRIIKSALRVRIINDRNSLVPSD
uniref:Uncharacterized protein n=1 Tax=Plectus sambesii TaxID=2011161 RepID=A0A914VQD0_9BILA